MISILRSDKNPNCFLHHHQHENNLNILKTSKQQKHFFWTVLILKFYKVHNFFVMHQDPPIIVYNYIKFHSTHLLQYLNLRYFLAQKNRNMFLQFAKKCFKKFIKIVYKKQLPKLVIKICL